MDITSFIDIVDNQLYMTALTSDFMEYKLRSVPELKGLNKIVRLALKTFSFAVYLHYPSQRGSYIIKHPIVVLGCTGAAVCCIDLIELNGFDDSRFFKSMFDGVRIVSGAIFTYKLLKIPIQDFYAELSKN